MATIKLFGYSIEENEGKLLITAEGLYAKSLLENLRAEVEAGRGWRVLSQLSPVGAIHRLSRNAFLAQQRLAEEGVEDDAEQKGLDIEAIFKQGFAESYQGYVQQIDRFGATLNELKAEFASSEAGKPEPALRAEAPEAATVAGTARKKKSK